MQTKKIAILFSGNGTNMEEIFKQLHNKIFNEIKIEIVLTICNDKNAFGIKRSRAFGVEPLIIEHKDFSSREDFDTELVKAIKNSGAQLTILAGFMRILSPIFTKNIKAINIHPSLLPLFKGATAIKDSFLSPMKVAGVSVHYVNSELDGGEIIAQKAIEKLPTDTLESFEQKIHQAEYELLPKTIISLLTK